jgi:ribonucleoside-diphosphate reductase beta chain
MLLVFPLNGLMKGMGKIIEWSIIDESQHTDGMIELFKVFVNENPDIRETVLTDSVKNIAIEMVSLEEAFIDLIFHKYSDGDFFDLTADKLKRYIKFIADHRLKIMGYEPVFGLDTTNPLPELDVMIYAPTHTNFFENRATDYAAISTTGSWSELWGC